MDYCLVLSVLSQGLGLSVTFLYWFTSNWSGIRKKGMCGYLSAFICYSIFHRHAFYVRCETLAHARMLQLSNLPFSGRGVLRGFTLVFPQKIVFSVFFLIPFFSQSSNDLLQFFHKKKFFPFIFSILKIIKVVKLTLASKHRNILRIIYVLIISMWGRSSRRLFYYRIWSLFGEKETIFPQKKFLI